MKSVCQASGDRPQEFLTGRDRAGRAAALGVPVLSVLLLPLALSAGSMSSARYSVAADSLDCAGRKTTSASYSNTGSAGGVVGSSTVAAPVESARHGYVGQLYDISSLAVSANPTNVNEGAMRPLRAAARLEDGTLLNLSGTSVAWSVAGGPIQSVSAAGVATAGWVYQDTVASVQGAYQGYTGSLGLLVRNVGNDDYGTYAGDGLDDAWQVQNFGENSPNGMASADPDGDGQNNRYEEMVGSIPTDGNSYFRFRIEPVPGQATQMRLIFSPRVGGRTYAVQARGDAGSGAFADLVSFSVLDAGLERAVTDLDATGTNKFYRVQITKP